MIRQQNHEGGDELDQLLARALRERPEARSRVDLAALAMEKVATREALAAARLGLIERYRRYSRYATAAAVLLIALTVAAVAYRSRASFTLASAETSYVAQSDDATGSESVSWSQVLFAAAATLTVAAVAFGLWRALSDDRPRLYPMSA
jgi:hypothetical protein